MAPDLGLVVARNIQTPPRRRDDEYSSATEGRIILSSDPFFIMSFNIAVYLTKKQLGQRTARLKQGEKMNELAKQMLLKHEITFNKMAEKLTLTQDNVIATVEAVGEELFQEGCNFGRIVATYALYMKILEFCLNNGMEDKVCKIQKATAKVVTAQKEWVIKNGGWDGFMNFFSDPSEKIWKGFMIATVGLGALATLLYSKA